MPILISKNDLQALGYGPGVSASIIRKAKELLVKRHFTYYAGKKVGLVPASAVEEILGFSLQSDRETTHD